MALAEHQGSLSNLAGMWEPTDLSSSKVMGNPSLHITDKGGEKGDVGSASSGPLFPPFPGSLSQRRTCAESPQEGGLGST